MSNWSEIPDRREPAGEGRVRLWFDLGGGRLRAAVVQRSMQTPETIARIGDALAAEGAHLRPRVYGDGKARR